MPNMESGFWRVGGKTIFSTNVQRFADLTRCYARRTVQGWRATENQWLNDDRKSHIEGGSR